LIAFCNEAAADIFGVQRDDVEGLGWGEAFFQDQANDSFNQVVVDVIWQQTVNLNREVEYRRPGGDVRRLSVTSSYLKENGEIAGVVVLLNDITLIHEIRQREKAALEERNRLQRERVEALRLLALDVAHEIRNPTTIIGGFARRLVKTMDDACDQENYLDQILEGAGRLEDIVRSVREYAELPSASLRPTSLPEIVEKAARLYHQRRGREPEGFEFDTPDLHLTADPALMGMALCEVMVNAEEHDKTGRPIQVRGRQRDDGLYIEVVDHGQGVLDKDKPFLFDLFFSTKARGVGMGLPKAHRILAEHRGYMRLDSSPGQGARAIMFLPQRRTGRD
jgi:PAS domain S-box-containing protein